MPPPAEVRDATLRIGSQRAPHDVVDDIRGCVRVLAREIATWDEEPSAAAIVTAETSVEGCRRLIAQLRIALDQKRRALNDARIPAHSETGT
jgi:hypothetical protein